MDKEKIRKFARLIAVGTEISTVSRDLQVSERTLRRWRKSNLRRRAKWPQSTTIERGRQSGHSVTVDRSPLGDQLPV